MTEEVGQNKTSKTHVSCFLLLKLQFRLIFIQCVILKNKGIFWILSKRYISVSQTQTAAEATNLHYSIKGQLLCAMKIKYVLI